MKNLVTKLLNGFGLHTLKRYLYNLGWLGLEKGLRFVLGIWLAPLMANYLSPERYGIYEFTISFVYLFSAFSFVGVNSLMIREYVSDRKAALKILGSAYALRLIGGGFSCLLVIIIGYWGWQEAWDLWVALPQNKDEFILILVLSFTLILNTSDIFTSFFQANVQSEKQVKVQLVVILLSAGLKLYGIKTAQETIFFISILLIESLVTAIGLFGFYQTNEKNIQKWQFHKPLFKTYLKESTTLIISAIAVTIYMRIDQVMVKDQLGNAYSGYYGAAVRLSEMWYVFPILLMNTLFPAIVEAKKGGLQKYHLRIQQLADLLIWASIGFSIFIQFTAEWLIVDLLPYGEAYLPSVEVLQLHVWASIFVASGGLGSRWMIIEKMHRYSMLQTLLGAVVNVILNYLLIPQMGLKGVAIATLVSYLLGALGLAIFIPQLHPLLRFHFNSLLAPVRLYQRLRS